MTLSAKWTAFSFFALTAVGGASLAFAGCTVTSSPGGVGDGGSSSGTSGTSGTSGDPIDSGADAPANVCEGNKQTGRPIVSEACQNKLNAVCCTELKTCFDIVPTAGDAGAGGTDDCNKFSDCIDACTRKADGTPETDQAKVDACQNQDCVSATQPNVVDAYDAITACATSKANDVCQ
jgi:hypothetical protein